MLSIEQKRSALEKLAARHGGRYTPEIIVAEAADKDHELHDSFNWDNESAGHQYRLDQARTLIRVVRINRFVERKLIQVVCYIHDPRLPGKQQGYVSIASLKKDRETGLAAVKMELARIQSAVDRGQGIAEALGLGAVFKEGLTKILQGGSPRAAGRPGQKAA
jgi:hypothetical protein